MTRPRRRPVRATARSASGLVLALVSAVTFGLSGALARGLLDAGWSAGAVVLVRIGLGALVVLPFGARRAARPLAPAAPQRRADRALRRARRRRRAVLLLLRGPVHAGRPGAADRVHRARRGRRVAVAAPRPAARADDAGRRRRRRARAGAGARPALRRRPQPAGVLWALAAMVGCAAYFVISGDDTQRPAAARRWPPAGWSSAPRARRCSALVGLLPMRAGDRPRRRTPARRRLVGAAAAARPGHRGGRLRRRHRRRSAGSAPGWPRSSR